MIKRKHCIRKIKCNPIRKNQPLMAHENNRHVPKGPLSLRFSGVKSDACAKC
jgi:hypothetical protein